MPGQTRADVGRVLEAVYAVEQARGDWFTGILDAAACELDAGGGVGAVLYDVSGDESLQIEGMAAVGAPSGWVQAGMDMHADPALAPGIIRSYRRVLCGPVDEYVETPYLPFVREQYRRWGLKEGVVINGLDASGAGFVIYVFSRRGLALTENRREVLRRLATHLSTANRLHRRITKVDANGAPVEAILEPRGRLDHAEREARSNDARTMLVDAVRRRESARGGRRLGAEQTLAAWRGLVGGRWTLADREYGGRRYVVARANAPVAWGPRALSERERQVIALAALGRSNKLIAYELGLAHSTVRVLLARARLKAKATSDHEVIWRARSSL